MIKNSDYQSVWSRFWLLVLIWCICVFFMACLTKNLINANALSGAPFGIFAVCAVWWFLGATCVLLDNYRRSICTVCSDAEARKNNFKFWNAVLDFKGYATRREFWWGLLTYGIIIWACMAAIMILFKNGMLALIACLVFLIPLWALFVRRLHDIGRSGWWTIIPSFGVVTCVVSWFCAVLWNKYWFFQNVGTDVWGIMVYLLSAVFIGLVPTRRYKKVQQYEKSRKSRK